MPRCVQPAAVRVNPIHANKGNGPTLSRTEDPSAAQVLKLVQSLLRDMHPRDDKQCPTIVKGSDCLSQLVGSG